MSEIFTSINGYLLHLYISNELDSINLEQFKYNSSSKSFDLCHENSVQLENLINKSVKNYNLAIIKDKNCLSNQDWLLIWLKLNNEKEYLFKTIIVIFNQTNSNCCFDSALSNSINTSFSLLDLNKDFDYLYDSYVLLDNKLFKNYMIYVIINENQKYNLKYYQNKKWNTLYLFESFKFSIKRIQVLDWLYIKASDQDNDEEIDLSFYSTKIFISFNLITHQNQIESNNLKSYLVYINTANQVCLREVKDEQLFGYFSKFTNLDKHELDKLNLDDLNENFFSKKKSIRDILMSSNSFKQNDILNLKYFNLIDLDLKCQIDFNLIACGKLILVFLCPISKSTYFIYLNNGEIKYKKKFEHLFNKFSFFYNQFEYNDNICSYFVMTDSRDFNYYFYFDQESNEMLKRFYIDQDIKKYEILNDYFMIDNDECEDSCYIGYLYIKNWSLKSFDLMPSLSKLSQSHNDNETRDENSFGLDLSRDLNELMSIDDNNDFMTDNEFFAKKSNHTKIEVVKSKQNCVKDLFKILKYKEHVTDLLLKEAMIEYKRKYSLIAELAKYSGRFDSANSKLPKLVELYSSDVVSKKDNIFREELNNLKKSNFDFKLSYTCYLDGFFMINLMFSTNIKFQLNDLNCLIYVKTKSREFMNIENNQKYIKIESSIFESLNKSCQNDKLIESLLNNLINKRLVIEDSNEMNLNDIFLLTIQIDLNCLNKLLSSYPNGDIKMNFQFYPIASFESIYLNINIYESFTKKQDLNDLKTFLSYLNRPSNCVTKFKILNLSLKQLNEILINKLNFDKVNITTMNVLIQQKHSLLLDCICITKNDDNLNGLDYKIQTGLIIISKSNQQSITLISLLNETINKSKSLSNANYSIKLDNSNQIDILLNSLNNELNLLLKEINNHDDDDGNESSAFLNNDSTIPADDAIINLICS